MPMGSKGICIPPSGMEARVGYSALNYLLSDVMIRLPNWLIVYGTNRNSGKTTLITRIISYNNSRIPITGIKISPHFHPLDDNDLIIEKCAEYVITKEIHLNTGKDSSRMLDAGAQDVFYIQVWDDNLGRLIPKILGLIPPGTAVICESGWARHLIDPGVFLILNRKGNTEMKSSLVILQPLADRWVEFDGLGFNLGPDDLSFEDGAWKIR